MTKPTRTAILLCVCILSGCASRQPQPRIPETIPTSLRTEIKKLYSSDATERGEAAIRLGFMYEKASPAIPFLLDILDDKQVLHSQLIGYTSAGQLAAEALVDIAGHNIADTLLAILKSGHTAASANVSVALGKLGDPRAVEPLICAMKRQNDDEPGLIARALVDIGEPAVEPLIIALQEGIPSVRASAAWALGEIGDDRAVEPLVAAMNDRDFHVKGRSATALDSLNWAPQNQAYRISYLLATIKRRSKSPGVVKSPIHGNWSDLVKIGQPAIEPIIAILKQEDSRVRKGAAWALGEIGDARAVEPLIDLLKDHNSDVRGYAAYALGNIDDNRSVESLFVALKDKESLVRGNASYALGEIGDARAIEPLIPLLNDKKKFVRGRTLEALQKITDENFENDKGRWQAWWDKNKDEILKSK